MKKTLLSLLLLAATLAQLLAGRVQAQTDPRNRSRLEIKPKAPAASIPSAKLSGFSLLRNPQAQDLNPKRALSINQYYRNLLLAQNTRPAPAKPKVVPSEPVAPAVSVAVERNAEELATVDKLFSNERLTVSNLYPNPAVDEYTNVDYAVGPGVNQAKLSFFNVLGSPVGDFELDRTERHLRIPTKDWNNGIYFYQLSLDGRTLATKKLLVRHQ